MNTIVTTTEIKINKLPIRNGNAKPTYCITDGKIYQSATDASIAEGIHISTICHACRNGTPANGKLWCYLEDLPKRILDISNVMAELIPDAEAYRTIKAEERRKEEERLEAERKERENAEKQRKLAEAIIAAKERSKKREEEFFERQKREAEELREMELALLALQNGNETMTI